MKKGFTIALSILLSGSFFAQKAPVMLDAKAAISAQDTKYEISTMDKGNTLFFEDFSSGYGEWLVEENSATGNEIW